MALEGGEGSASDSGRFLPPAKTRYPLYRRLSGPQGRSGHVRKISPPPGFDPRTVQPIASRYTDWAARPTLFIRYAEKYGRTGQAMYDNIIRRMRLVCWIIKSADTHSEYVIRIFHGTSGYANAPHCYVYTYIACLVYVFCQKCKRVRREENIMYSPWRVNCFMQ